MSGRLHYEAGFHVSWERFHRDARLLAEMVHRRAETPWRALVGIARGGMVPACILARELEIRVVETIALASYQHQDQGALQLLKAPDGALMGDGTGVLIVDDLVDTGRTLAFLRERYPRAHLATVYAKPMGAQLADSYVSEVSQESWIYLPWDMGLTYVGPLAAKEGEP